MLEKKPQKPKPAPRAKAAQWSRVVKPVWNVLKPVVKEVGKEIGREVFEKGKEAAKTVVTTVEKQVKKVEDLLTNEAKNLIKANQRAVKENPYKNIAAHVRLGNQLHAFERSYLQKRKPKVKGALEKLLGRGLDGKYIPTIALIGSGGGYRAMLCTTGFLAGAQKIGLLDATTYMTALSGSTWALGAWMASGLPINQLRDQLAIKVGKHIKDVTPAELKLMGNMLATKIAFDQPVAMVDLYGALLGNRLLADFGNDRHMVYLSQQHQRIANGDWVFPIYTAVDGRMAVAANPPWFEYTPYEVGCADYGAYVPTWAYGRRFINGRSVDFAPEQSLGYQLGTYGSAFAAHFDVVFRHLTDKIENNIVKDYVYKHVIEPIAGKRVTKAWAEVRNFMRDMPGQQVRDRKTIKLVDAALAFNLPYPPVSGERPERKADIMIFFDASGGTVGNELKKTELYARSRRLKFPQIDYTNIDKRSMSIFKDPNDLTVPVVIYMPRINDAALWNQYRTNPNFSLYSPIAGFDMEYCVSKGFCGTMNFKYAQDQANKLMLVTEFNMVANKENIKNALNWLIDRKS